MERNSKDGRAKRPAEESVVCAVFPGGNWGLICCVEVSRKLCGLGRYAKRSETVELKTKEIIKSFALPGK